MNQITNPNPTSNPKTTNSSFPNSSSPDSSSSDLRWEKVKEKVIFRNEYIGLRNDDVTRPDGTPAQYAVIENRSFVNVFCQTPSNGFLMVRQYRYPWGCFSWEPPSGIIEEGEAPELAAKREVEEETGYKVIQLASLFKVHPFAMCAGWAHVFLAQVETGGKQHLDPGEFLEWKEMTGAEIDQLVSNGEFLHGMSLLGWLRVKSILNF
ncbi:MAG: NUDIX hydrolase [Promethearchaeota archaeon]